MDPTNGSLEPDRYFARVESNVIPLWVPSPAFGDLAGVRVTYHSPGDSDPLYTELEADIRRILAGDFDAAPVREVAFAATDSTAVDGRPPEIAVVPAAVAGAMVLGLGFWHRRQRAP